MEKNELVCLKDEKTDLMNIVQKCYEKKQIDSDCISLYDLFLFHTGVQENIEQKIEIIKHNIREKIIPYMSSGINIDYDDREDIIEITEKTHAESFSYLTSVLHYQLTYKKIEGDIYLVNGPSEMEDSLYKANEIIMTEIYDSMKVLFRLYELKQKYRSNIFLKKDGFSIALEENSLSIVKNYSKESKYALRGNRAFFLIYKKEENVIKKQFFSAFRDVMLCLKDREEDFLRGFYIDKKSLEENMRELLEEYMKTAAEVQKKTVKQKILFDWFKRPFGSNS